MHGLSSTMACGPAPPYLARSHGDLVEARPRKGVEAGECESAWHTTQPQKHSAHHPPAGTRRPACLRRAWALPKKLGLDRPYSLLSRLNSDQTATTALPTSDSPSRAAASEAIPCGPALAESRPYHLCARWRLVSKRSHEPSSVSGPTGQTCSACRIQHLRACPSQIPPCPLDHVGHQFAATGSWPERKLRASDSDNTFLRHVLQIKRPCTGP